MSSQMLQTTPHIVGLTLDIHGDKTHWLTKQQTHSPSICTLDSENWTRGSSPRGPQRFLPQHEGNNSEDRVEIRLVTLCKYKTVGLNRARHLHCIENNRDRGGGRGRGHGVWEVFTLRSMIWFSHSEKIKHKYPENINNQKIPSVQPNRPVNTGWRHNTVNITPRCQND